MIMINLGLQILEESFYLALIIILNGIALLFFSFYAWQIKINEAKIRELEDWKEDKEELLNTIKDIIILKKVSKL